MSASFSGLWVCYVYYVTTWTLRDKDLYVMLIKKINEKKAFPPLTSLHTIQYIKLSLFCYFRNFDIESQYTLFSDGAACTANLF